MLKSISLNYPQVADATGHDIKPLTEVSAGSYRIVRLTISGRDEARVRRLGICDGRRIELLGIGDPLMIVVGNSRVGISRLLAANVLVEKIEER